MDYEPGVLEAFCCDADGAVLGTCSLKTTGRAAGFSCRLWQERDALSGRSWPECAARSGYLFQILVNLTDEEGAEVVWDDREIKVQVQGPGELAGLDNGDLADVTPFSCHVRKTFAGNLVAYVRRTGPGRIRVFVELAGAEGAQNAPVQREILIG